MTEITDYEKGKRFIQQNAIAQFRRSHDAQTVVTTWAIRQRVWVEVDKLGAYSLRETDVDMFDFVFME